MIKQLNTIKTKIQNKQITTIEELKKESEAINFNIDNYNIEQLEQLEQLILQTKLKYFFDKWIKNYSEVIKKIDALKNEEYNREVEKEKQRQKIKDYEEKEKIKNFASQLNKLAINQKIKTINHKYTIKKNKNNLFDLYEGKTKMLENVLAKTIYKAI